MKNTPIEWERIQKIAKIIERSDKHTSVPLGDDCFVFKNFPGESVWCQDLQIEGVHFERRYTSAKDLGHKALAVNISDILAMCGTPHYAQVSLALPPEVTDDWIEEFYSSMVELADQCQCQIIGGDLTASPHSIFVDVGVFGSTEKAITRKGAISGDLLLCSGPLGLSASGLLALKNDLSDFELAKSQHRRPRPRWDLLAQIKDNRPYIRSMMDCSDGLVNDAYKLIPFMGGLNIFGDNLPIHPETEKLSQQLGISKTDLALWGGEDFQLLVATSTEHYDKFKDWILVGQFTDNEGICITQNNRKERITEFKGFQHFH